MERRNFLKGLVAAPIAIGSLSQISAKEPDEPKREEQNPIHSIPMDPVDWVERYLYVDLWEGQKDVLRLSAHNIVTTRVLGKFPV